LRRSIQITHLGNFDRFTDALQYQTVFNYCIWSEQRHCDGVRDHIKFNDIEVAFDPDEMTAQFEITSVKERKISYEEICLK